MPVIKRQAEYLVEEALKDSRVVLIIGARQVGKSTLANQIAKRNHFPQVVTLDDRSTYASARQNPNGFIADLQHPVVIDEFQYAPDLLYAIKQTVDQNNQPGQFLLTGSANILSAPRLYEALTGRVEIIRLQPLAQSEIEQNENNFVDSLFDTTQPPRVTATQIGRKAFVDRALRGGYPPILQRRQESWTRWFGSYITTTLERDLRDIASIKKMHLLPKLLRLIATRSANIVSYRNIAQALEVDVKTIQSYIKLLETIFLVCSLPAWRPSLGAREVHAPKLHITDSGLLSYLLRADADRIASDDQITGRIFESFCVMEIAKHAQWSALSPTLYHYRDGRDEIDLVLELRSGEVVCVEVKAAATVYEQDIRALRKLQQKLKERFQLGIILYTGAQTIPFGNGIWAVPVSSLWAT